VKILRSRLGFIIELVEDLGGVVDYTVRKKVEKKHFCRVVYFSYSLIFVYITIGGM
jgi:hypothetical protein